MSGPCDGDIAIDLPEDRADAEAAIGRIRERADAIKRRELETARRRFAAHGPMTDAHAEILSATADRLIDRLLAVPERRLEAASDAGDTDTLRTAVELFDADD